eukprot:751422-Hanusia_phi.AAC.6
MGPHHRSPGPYRAAPGRRRGGTRRGPGHRPVTGRALGAAAARPGPGNFESPQTSNGDIRRGGGQSGRQELIEIQLSEEGKTRKRKTCRWCERRARDAQGPCAVLLSLSTRCSSCAPAFPSEDYARLQNFA